MIRTGFILNCTARGWMGGVSYFRNLLHAAPNPPVEPVLLLPPDVQDKLLGGFPKVEIVHTPLAGQGGRTDWLRKAGKALIGRDLAMERFLAANNIAVLSHSGHLGQNARIPAIGWIPDFQHRRLPGFFSPEEVARRDRTFQRLCRSCPLIIVSSHDAGRDLAAFAPGAESKCRVLRFVSWGTAAEGGLPQLADLKTRYGFDGPYFHLPNQFWAHKNHRLMVEALAILRDRGRDVLVLATGHTDDKRRPEHFAELMRRAEDLGVTDRFRVLGLVPGGDLAALMNHAVAVVNPSLFEGWSTTVEEAKSIGKRVVLSDIPIHREQAPQHGRFFDPHDAGQLADALWDSLATWNEQEDTECAARAAAALPGRITAFGQAYAAIVTEAAALAG